MSLLNCLLSPAIHFFVVLSFKKNCDVCCINPAGLMCWIQFNCLYLPSKLVDIPLLVLGC